jgi:hypothetical protein
MLGVLFYGGQISVQPSDPKQPTSIACTANAIKSIHNARSLPVNIPRTTKCCTSQIPQSMTSLKSVQSCVCSCASNWMNLSVPAYFCFTAADKVRWQFQNVGMILRIL